jgi:hypothetical protein
MIRIEHTAVALAHQIIVAPLGRCQFVALHTKVSDVIWRIVIAKLIYESVCIVFRFGE